MFIIVIHNWGAPHPVPRMSVGDALIVENIKQQANLYLHITI
jgi:hypothetical protein